MCGGNRIQVDKSKEKRGGEAYTKIDTQESEKERQTRRHTDQ